MPIKVTPAARFMNRQSSAIGKSVYKSLTELITNSDDSYTRLVKDAKADPADLQEIVVIYDKAKREFKVIDRAEGMTDEEMAAKLGEYGNDTSGSSEGASVRGLFGQGISDVLFYHTRGLVQSIVDRALYRCPFVKDKKGEWYIDPKRTRAKVDGKLRDSLGIPEGNGTVVSFELAADVSKPVRRFVEKLQRFYMLRLITSDKGKKVRYIEIDEKGRKKTFELRYDFPPGKLLTKEIKSLRFEDFPPVQVEIELRRSDKPLESEDNGLLVFDEKNAVYDRTLFGYPDDYPGAETLFGTVRLTGARKIILSKMNQLRPEEILSDSRNGFDRAHEFYVALEAVVKPVIEPFMSEGPAVRTVKDDLSEEQAENQRKALDLFDDLYKDVIDDTSMISDPKKTRVPPSGGLEFDRREIKTTVNKNYGLGININTTIVPIGAVVTLTSDSPTTIDVTPVKGGLKMYQLWRFENVPLGRIMTRSAS